MVNLKFGGYQKPASIHNQTAARFGELLCARLGGALDFQLTGNVLDLGRKSGDLPSMVESGELACCYISTVRFTRWVPELAVIDLPFVVTDRPSVQRALRGGFGAYMKRRFAESSPFRLLGLWDNGFRHLTNRVRPIHTPVDCQGLKMRTQMSASHGEALSALGFVPIPADVKEFVEQVGDDRFEAQDNPLTNTYNFGAEDDVILKKLDPVENEIVILTSVQRAAFVRAMEPVLKKYRGSIDAQVFRLLSGEPS